LDWASIVWAKQEGYRYYDLEGIQPDAARAILAGQPLPEALEQTPTSYKLGFGGEVQLFPAAYEYLTNPLLRRAYTTVFPKISHWAAVKRARNYFRTR
jgi:lipid II:glycine glycyltransferase (peptidoglycan interpeptide bridge formation enzyme)